MQQWYWVSCLKALLPLDISRKLAFDLLEYIFEEEIDSKADYASNRVIGEFSREEHPQRSGRNYIVMQPQQGPQLILQGALMMG